MLIDYAVIFIVALMPIVSLILVFQSNPYHALVIRAILGAVATLVYAVLGGADVALTEAMIGTLLAVALYIIAVRSSQVMRMGVLSDNHIKAITPLAGEADLNNLFKDVHKAMDRYYLRLELIEYPDLKALKIAISNHEIHGMCIPAKHIAIPKPNYIISLRVTRLYEIFSQELTSSNAAINLVNSKQD